ncbi:MAG TPA: hypothetical protein VF680_07080 [Allosphingosinicella sp.]|jgi:hypothetical protein
MTTTFPQPDAVGLFTAGNSFDIPTTVDRVQTSGYGAVGSGAAEYIYDSALTSTYVDANPRTAFLSFNQRVFRLDPKQRLTIEMFGGKGDLVLTNSDGNLPGTVASGRTDNLDAFNAYARFARYSFESTARVVVPPLHFAAAGYYFGGSLEPYSMVHLIGAGAESDATTGTMFRFPADTTGIVINLHNSGNGGTITWGSQGGAATGSVIENIYFLGGGGTDTSKHGCWMRAKATLRNCVFDSFAGAGTAIIGSGGAGGADYGSPNEWRVENCDYRANKGIAAFLVKGLDANAGTAINVRIKDTFGIGILDQSSLGNTYLNPQIDGSGEVLPAGIGRGRVFHAGHVYKLVKPTDVGTTPGTNPNVWALVAGDSTSAANSYWPQWSATTTYQSGAGMIVEGASNQSQIFGIYTESVNVNTANTGTVLIGGAVIPVEGNNHLFASGETLRNRAGIGTFRNWSLPAHTAKFGAYSHVTLGARTGTAHSVLAHYDQFDDVFMSYHRDEFGNYVYASSFEGGGGADVYSVSGKNTNRYYGTGEKQRYVFTVAKMAFRDPNQGSDDMRIHSMAPAVPTSGAHARGEIVWNMNPSAGGKIGWVCVTSGTPGTWKPFGPIDA